MGKPHCRIWWWIIAFTKLVFQILFHQTIFIKFRLFFIQLFFMYEVRKCPKHSASELLPLLLHCRDPMKSKPSPRNIKILKIGDGYVIAASILLNTFCFNLLRDLDIHPRNESSKTSQNSSTTKTFKKYNQRLKLTLLCSFNILWLIQRTLIIVTEH